MIYFNFHLIIFFFHFDNYFHKNSFLYTHCSKNKSANDLVYHLNYILSCLFLLQSSFETFFFLCITRFMLIIVLYPCSKIILSHKKQSFFKKTFIRYILQTKFTWSSECIFYNFINALD